MHPFPEIRIKTIFLLYVYIEHEHSAEGIINEIIKTGMNSFLKINKH
jgi:hypothetical protein